VIDQLVFAWHDLSQSASRRGNETTLDYPMGQRITKHAGEAQTLAKVESAGWKDESKESPLSRGQSAFDHVVQIATCAR
jgi:hypothetical protein